MPPPNTPEEGMDSSTSIDFDYPVPDYVLHFGLELRVLEYEGHVDENLICPICRLPFISPVITNCDHVFCQSCISRAHAINPICPIDRLPLDLATQTRTAPKIIHNQLDSLLVKCPNWKTGCKKVLARSLAEAHIARYCPKTVVPCPSRSCGKPIVRKYFPRGCLHYPVLCKYCNQLKEMANFEEHQKNECPGRMAECELCAGEYVRHERHAHYLVCPETQAACKYAPYGCDMRFKRKDLESHAILCPYRVVAAVGETLSTLRSEMSDLKDKERLAEQRISFLENRADSESQAAGLLPKSSSMEVLGDFQSTGPPTPSHADNAPYQSRDQYFLSLFESLETKVERVSSTVNDVDYRQSMMLSNKTAQLRDQLSDIRSTIGVLSMHVRWLMNCRLQERGRLGTYSASPSATAARQNGNTYPQDNAGNPNPHSNSNSNPRPSGEHPPRL